MLRHRARPKSQPPIKLNSELRGMSPFSQQQQQQLRQPQLVTSGKLVKSGTNQLQQANDEGHWSKLIESKYDKSKSQFNGSLRDLETLDESTDDDGDWDNSPLISPPSSSASPSSLASSTLSLSTISSASTVMAAKAYRGPTSSSTTTTNTTAAAAAKTSGNSRRQHPATMSRPFSALCTVSDEDDQSSSKSSSSSSGVSSTGTGSSSQTGPPPPPQAAAEAYDEALHQLSLDVSDCLGDLVDSVVADSSSSSQRPDIAIISNEPLLAPLDHIHDAAAIISAANVVEATNKLVLDAHMVIEIDFGLDIGTGEQHKLHIIKLAQRQAFNALKQSSEQMPSWQVGIMERTNSNDRLAPACTASGAVCIGWRQLGALKQSDSRDWPNDESLMVAGGSNGSGVFVRGEEIIGCLTEHELIIWLLVAATAAAAEPRPRRAKRQHQQWYGDDDDVQPTTATRNEFQVPPEAQQLRSHSVGNREHDFGSPEIINSIDWLHETSGAIKVKQQPQQVIDDNEDGDDEGEERGGGNLVEDEDDEEDNGHRNQATHSQPIRAVVWLCSSELDATRLKHYWLTHCQATTGAWEGTCGESVERRQHKQQAVLDKSIGIEQKGTALADIMENDGGDAGTGLFDQQKTIGQDESAIEELHEPGGCKAQPVLEAASSSRVALEDANEMQSSAKSTTSTGSLLPSSTRQRSTAATGGSKASSLSKCRNSIFVHRQTKRSVQLSSSGGGGGSNNLATNLNSSTSCLAEEKDKNDDYGDDGDACDAASVERASRGSGTAAAPASSLSSSLTGYYRNVAARLTGGSNKLIHNLRDEMLVKMGTRSKRIASSSTNKQQQLPQLTKLTVKSGSICDLSALPAADFDSKSNNTSNSNSSVGSGALSHNNHLHNQQQQQPKQEQHRIQRLSASLSQLNGKANISGPSGSGVPPTSRTKLGCEDNADNRCKQKRSPNDHNEQTRRLELPVDRNNNTTAAAVVVSSNKSAEARQQQQQQQQIVPPIKPRLSILKNKQQQQCQKASMATAASDSRSRVARACESSLQTSDRRQEAKPATASLAKSNRLPSESRHKSMLKNASQASSIEREIDKSECKAITLGASATGGSGDGGIGRSLSLDRLAAGGGGAQLIVSLAANGGGGERVFETKSATMSRAMASEIIRNRSMGGGGGGKREINEIKTTEKQMAVPAATASSRRLNKTRLSASSSLVLLSPSNSSNNNSNNSTSKAKERVCKETKAIQVQRDADYDNDDDGDNVDDEEGNDDLARSMKLVPVVVDATTQARQLHGEPSSQQDSTSTRRSNRVISIDSSESRLRQQQQQQRRKSIGNAELIRRHNEQREQQKEERAGFNQQSDKTNGSEASNNNKLKVGDNKSVIRVQASGRARTAGAHGGDDGGDDDDELFVSSGSLAREQAFERMRMRASCYDITRLMSRNNTIQSQLARLRLNGSTNNLRPSSQSTAAASANTSSSTSDLRQRKCAEILLVDCNGAPQQAGQETVARCVPPSDTKKMSMIATGIRRDATDASAGKPTADSLAIQVGRRGSGQKSSSNGRNESANCGVEVQEHGDISSDLKQQVKSDSSKTISDKNQDQTSDNDNDSDNASTCTEVAGADEEEETEVEEIDGADSLQVDKSSSDAKGQASSKSEADTASPSTAANSGKSAPSLSKFSLLRQSFNQKTLSSMLKFSTNRASLRVKTSGAKATVAAPLEKTIEGDDDNEASEQQADSKSNGAGRLVVAKNKSSKQEKVKSAASNNKLQLQQQQQQIAAIDSATLMLYNRHLQRQQQQQQQLLIQQQQQQQQYAMHWQQQQQQQMLQIQQRHSQHQQLAYMANHYGLATAHDHQHGQYQQQQMSALWASARGPAASSVAPAPITPVAMGGFGSASMAAAMASTMYAVGPAAPVPQLAYHFQQQQQQQQTYASSAESILRKSILRSSKASKDRQAPLVATPQAQYSHQQQQLVPVSVNHHSSVNIVYADTLAAEPKIVANQHHQSSQQLARNSTQVKEKQGSSQSVVHRGSSLGASMRKTVKSILVNRSLTSSNEPKAKKEAADDNRSQVSKKQQPMPVQEAPAAKKQLKSALKKPASIGHNSIMLNSEGSDGDASSTTVESFSSSSSSSSSKFTTQAPDSVARYPKSSILKKPTSTGGSAQPDQASVTSTESSSSSDTNFKRATSARCSRRLSSAKPVASRKQTDSDATRPEVNRDPVQRKNVTFSTKLTSIL